MMYDMVCDLGPICCALCWYSEIVIVKMWMMIMIFMIMCDDDDDDIYDYEDNDVKCIVQAVPAGGIGDQCS